LTDTDDSDTETIQEMMVEWSMPTYPDLSTWEAAMLPLVENRDHIAMARAAAGRRTALKAKDVSLDSLGHTSMWRIIQKFNLEHILRIDVYGLEGGLVQLPEIIPQCVEVTQIFLQASSEFWLGLEHQRRVALERSRARQASRKHTAKKQSDLRVPLAIVDWVGEEAIQNDEEQEIEGEGEDEDIEGYHAEFPQNGDVRFDEDHGWLEHEFADVLEKMGVQAPHLCVICSLWMYHIRFRSAGSLRSLLFYLLAVLTCPSFSPHFFLLRPAITYDTSVPFPPIPHHPR
jgi:hypothetical protein